METLEDSCKPIAPDVAIGRISRMDAINNKSVMEASLRNANNPYLKAEFLSCLKADCV